MLKPRGRGPFPAVLLSHAAGGNAQTYGRALGSVMRTWGLVCIALNYTHAAGGASWCPWDAASTPCESGKTRFARTRLSPVLARVRYVDLRRVAAHGHSMGAFVTTAFVAAYPPTSALRHTRPAALWKMPSTPRSPRIQRCCRGSEPGTPLTGCSNGVSQRKVETAGLVRSRMYGRSLDSAFLGTTGRAHK